MADKKEHDLTLASDCGWIRAIDSNGKSVKIDKSDFIELIRSNLPAATSEKKGLMDKNAFMDRRTTETDLSLLDSGIYPIFDGNPDIPELGFNYGLLIVFKSVGYYDVIIAVEYNLGIVKMKTSSSGWKTISFT